jgi:hypothetical protein
VPEPTRVLMTVDTEEAWDWSGPYPTARYSVEHVSRLGSFQSVCERHGMRPTYFANYAVMADDRARSTMLELARRPDVEIGMHIHPWNTPPVVLESPVVPRDTYLHTRPDSEIREKLEATYEAFLGAGLRPTSFRGGRYSTGGAIHRFLREAGFVADCSIVPYTRWSELGSPDFSHDGVMPRRIAPSTVAGQPLWEIPQSAGFTRGPFGLWAGLHNAVEHSSLRHLRLIGAADRLGLVRRVWLNFEMGSVSDWVPFLQRLRRMQVPVVTLTVHSSSLFVGPGPYTRTVEHERSIAEKIEGVLSAIERLDGFVPSTATEAAEHLERLQAQAILQPESPSS